MTVHLYISQLEEHEEEEYPGSNKKEDQIDNSCFLILFCNICSNSDLVGESRVGVSVGGN